MLIPRGDKAGYLWDTVAKEYVKDPSYSLKEMNKIETANNIGNSKEIKDILGVSVNRQLALNADIRYLITEEEWNLATPDSTKLVKMAYENIKDNLKVGVLPNNSFIFSIGHKAKVVDLASTFLVNAHTGGLSINKIQYLTMLDKFKLDELEQDLIVVIAPHEPSTRELSTLITVLEYRDQLAKPTIIITSKYSVHPYRLVTSTESEPRYDLGYLIALQQERSLDSLEIMAEGVDFNFKKVKNKHRAMSQLPDDEKVAREYESELRSSFVDISQKKSINVSKTFFDIDS